MLGEKTKRILSAGPLTLAVWFVCLIGLSVSGACWVGHAVYKKQSDVKDRLLLTVEENNKLLSDKSTELQISLQKLEDEYRRLESRYTDLASNLVPPQHKGEVYTAGLSRKLPPIEQPLVREGKFAVDLATAFNLTSSLDEATAESYLASINIMPRNGWISDYPLTPDIIAEVRESVAISSSLGYLHIPETDAVGLVDNIGIAINLPVESYNPSSDSLPGSAGAAPEAPQYVEPSVVEDYYEDNKPPIITYYPPPTEYAYLYDWVPSPFLCEGFSFRGFFILVDFERRHHKHAITNHLTNANGTVTRISATTRARTTANRLNGSSANAANTPGPEAPVSIMSSGPAPDTYRTVPGSGNTAGNIEKSASSQHADRSAASRSPYRDVPKSTRIPPPQFPAGGGYGSESGGRLISGSGTGGSHNGGSGRSVAAGGHR